MIVDESSTAAGMQYFLKRELYQSPSDLSGTAAPLRSRFHNFYHWMIDCLPRLIALAESPWAASGPIDLLCCQPPRAHEQFFLDRFPADTFRIRRIEPGVVYRVETLLFTPLKGRRFAGYLPHRYPNAIRKMVLSPGSRTSESQMSELRTQKKSGPAPAPRLYISRRRAQYRHVSNEDDLMRLLAEYGFERVELEALTIPEQAALFADADAVVAPHGAGLANLVYAREAQVLELFPNPVVTPHYYFLSRSLGHSYWPLTGNATTLNPKAFTVDLRSVESCLQSWAL